MTSGHAIPVACQKAWHLLESSHASTDASASLTEGAANVSPAMISCRDLIVDVLGCDGACWRRSQSVKGLVLHTEQQMVSAFLYLRLRPVSVSSQQCRISSQTFPQKLPSSQTDQSSSPRGSALSANACTKHVVLKGSTHMEASNQSAQLSFSRSRPRPSLYACAGSVCDRRLRE